MFDSVQYVRSICEQRKIAVSRLEKDCGFSNGYLNPKKMNRISYDRAVIIAEYLGITVESIMNGEDKKEQPIATDELSSEKQKMYDIIDNLSAEQIRRLIQIACAAFDEQTN